MRFYVTYNWGYQDSVGIHDKEGMVVFNVHKEVGVYLGIRYAHLKEEHLYSLLRICYNTNKDGSVRK